MDMTRLLHLVPTMGMVGEYFAHRRWAFQLDAPRPREQYGGVRLYTGAGKLRRDVLYVLKDGQTDFPTDDFAYVSTAPLPGRANHIHCPARTTEEVLDALMELYDQYAHREERLNDLVYQGGSLEELCRVGAALMENPVCVHDDWFIVLGMSQRARELMAPELVMSSELCYIPRAIVEDFRYDQEYLETYAHRTAQIWGGDGARSSLYVNLWDGEVYRGRLLVLRDRRNFREGDFILAQVLAQRAILLLQRGEPDRTAHPGSMDGIVFALLRGQGVEAADFAELLRDLHWAKTDLFLCVRVRSQQGRLNTVMERLLHSDLFRLFPGSYVLLAGQDQCVVVDLSRFEITAGELRHRLAPICRDYCLYAGISSPVQGLDALYQAHFQAGAALEQAFKLRSDRWVLHFSDCALEYVMGNLPQPLTPLQLVHPDLPALLRHDREHGTEYYETLRTYLLLERNVSATAEQLIIHRTTLLYRLKKLRALCRADWDDPSQRLELTLSIWLLDRYPPPETTA